MPAETPPTMPLPGQNPALAEQLAAAGGVLLMPNGAPYLHGDPGQLDPFAAEAAQGTIPGPAETGQPLPGVDDERAAQVNTEPTYDPNHQVTTGNPALDYYNSAADYREVRHNRIEGEKLARKMEGESPALMDGIDMLAKSSKNVKGPNVVQLPEAHLLEDGEDFVRHLTEFVTKGYSTQPGVGLEMSEQQMLGQMKMWARSVLKTPNVSRLLPVMADIRKMLAKEDAKDQELRNRGIEPQKLKGPGDKRRISETSDEQIIYGFQTDTGANTVGYELRALNIFAEGLEEVDPDVGELFKRDAGLWEGQEDEPGMECDLDALRDILINTIVPEGEEVDAESTEWATIMMLRRTGEYLSRRESRKISDDEYEDMLKGRALGITPDMIPILADASRSLRTRFEEASAALESDNDDEPSDEHIKAFDDAKFALVDLDELVSVGLSSAHPELFDQLIDLEEEEGDPATVVMPAELVQPVNAQPSVKRERLAKHPKIAAKVGAVILAVAIRTAKKRGTIEGVGSEMNRQAVTRTELEMEIGTQSSDDIQRESIVPREIAIEMARLRMEEEAVTRSGGRINATTASRMFDRLHGMLGGGRDDVLEYAEATKRQIHDELISNPDRRMPSPDDPDAMSKYASAVVTRARRIVSANPNISSREVQDGYALAILNQIFADRTAQEIHDELLG